MTKQENNFGAETSNLQYLETLYRTYSENPAAVESSWRYFFEGMDFASSKDRFFQEPQTIYTGDFRLYQLIQNYRTYGYLAAAVNPITTAPTPAVQELQLTSCGLTEEDLEKEFPTFGLLLTPHAKLREIIDALKKSYCGRVGIEYMGLHSQELERFIQSKVEPIQSEPSLSMEEKRMILHHLNKSELFEVFLHTKFVGQKRFSLEGGETLIPMLAEILEQGTKEGVSGCVIGMTHRGRLNVLANILKKSYATIFNEFEDNDLPDSFEGSGDVKYHKGFSSKVSTSSGREVNVILAANPSHLESVDPVVEGVAKALQVAGHDEEQLSILPVLIHGDASISGQGVVYETLQLIKLPGYSTGGTVHIVINNQIGFTTPPKEARSTKLCTDIARVFSAPIFHVNAEDPESALFVTSLAVQLRQRFHCDVFIELNCYRKYGHNESDEPAYTQPIDYQLIKKKRPIREIYRDHLIHQGVFEKELAETLENEFKANLQAELDEIKKTPKPSSQRITAPELLPNTPKELLEKIPTHVEASVLKTIIQKATQLPEHFRVHRKIESLLEERAQMLVTKPDQKSIDWAVGELLAYGSLVLEGHPVRLSGQDSKRGTFSHRHGALVDQVEATQYIPLRHLAKDQGRFDLLNSSLSEFAILGFEYGYSIGDPTTLVLWEAQFGDFANGAQVIIDQFITTAEQKWGLQSGVTLLLPHGYEGQGPEHSSARIERFLQLAGDANIQIVNPTTPAQFFHLLRRQALRAFRKPLIVLTPKGLLRHKECVSSLDELTKGSFEEILDDPLHPKGAKRLLLCSGRIFYDLQEERKALAITDQAIIRIEQLYPLHRDKLKEILENYQRVKEVVWVQDEPSNMGAWDFIRPFLQEIIKEGVILSFAGRKRSASPAVGSHTLHHLEHEAIMRQAFGG